MTVIKTVADVDDGSLTAEGGYKSTGALEYRKATRQGTVQGVTLQVDPQRDPVVGDRVTLGMLAYGINPPGGSNPESGVVQAEGFTRYKKDSGFALPPGGHAVVTASIRTSRMFYKYNDEGNWYSDDSGQIWSQEWASPLSTSAWLDLENARINNYPDCEIYHVMSDRSQPNNTDAQGNLQEAGGEKFLLNLKARLAAGADHQLAHTMFSQTQQFPRSRYWAYHIVSSNNGKYPARFKPTLILRTMKTHSLNGVLGASIQMTDGTAVFLRRVGSAINLYYQRINQTTPTLIRKIPTTSAEESVFYKSDVEANQAFSICRDGSNNIYVVGMDGRAPSTDGNAFRPFLMNAFKYNGNYSWQYWSPTTAGENTLTTNYTSRGMPNNFQALWVPGSDFGSAGQVAVVFSHRDSQWAPYQLGVYSMYAGYMMGSGNRNADVEFLAPASVQSNWRPMNSSGTGLDAVHSGGNGVRFSSFVSASADQENERHGGGKSSIGSNGSVSVPTVGSSTYLDAPHDPDAKSRQIWMGETPTYYAYMRSGQLMMHRMSDDSLYRSIDFTTLGLTNFPSKAQLESAQYWDVIWDTLRSKLWVYYMDSQNNRLIRKVGYDPIANTIDSSTQLTPTVLGSSGDRIIALRTPRQAMDPRCVILDVAMVTAVGDPTTLISVRDLTMNKAPMAPLLDSITAFNATSSKAFPYTFNDPGDVCSGHQVQIRRVSTMATIYDSGKTVPQSLSGGANRYQHNIPANTLSNDTQYQVRILTYDAVDVAGVWSDWSSFSTSGTGGTVVITEPAADMLNMNKSSLTVAWTYSNSTPSKTQAGYQIRVYNDVTNALFSDTGVITSTATSRAMSGFLTDTRYRIEVSVRDSSGGMSGAGVRIIYPDFDNPAAPVLDAIRGEGFIEIRVTNPAPTGDNPVAVSNQIARKEAGAADSTYKIIGTCPLNGAFKDYTVASKTNYTYKARSST